MAKILAFSGSPIKDGNIEKGLKAVLAATSGETEFIRLAELNMKVCLGCKKCASTNRCAFKDDINPILDKIVKADAIIMSGYPSFGSLNALSKIFIERNWPLRHNHILTKGKVGASVICGRIGLEDLDNYFRHYFVNYLMTDYQGTLVLKGNVPCMTCGYGEECPGSGFLKEYGPSAKVTEDKFSNFEKNEQSLLQAKNLGEAINKAIKSKK
jgi:multimeric flavodoxin WrbA